MGEVLTLEQAVQNVSDIRAQGGTLVLTNGHFDLLHVGHLDYLERARALGSVLFVGVNGDGSTRRLKGAGRPLVPAEERARLLAALAPVSTCIIFEEDTAIHLVETLRPEVYVKGGDYAAPAGGAAKPLPERAPVEAYGGHVALIEYMPGHSTSELIARVRALPEGM
ncbi:MAG: adenylyltransferase/cytidyltransferase family protein [Anaerolineae bacterium]